MTLKELILEFIPMYNESTNEEIEKWVFEKQKEIIICDKFLIVDVPPPRNEYVLVKTPHCKCPVTVAYWTGVKWLGADDKCEIMNVNEWFSLNAL